MLTSDATFFGFVTGFNSQHFMSIIDAGSEKERADHRIGRALEHNDDNPMCKHILFAGCCHDTGYLTFLRP
jgi:hypothetical protein